jgi:hypothetical protein
LITHNFSQFFNQYPVGLTQPGQRGTALKGGLMQELIVDEPTACRLIEKYIAPFESSGKL